MNDTQAVTVVQPRVPSTALSVDVATVAAWAGALVAIASALALVYKLLTRDVRRDVDDVKANLSRDIASVEHKVRNHGSRLDAIEHLRTADIERIVRVETSLSGLEKGLERVDNTIHERFDQLAASIREIRVVGPR